MELTSFGIVNNTYILNCRLWLVNGNKIIVICKFKFYLKRDEIISKAEIKRTIEYGEYKVNINIQITNMKLKKLYYNLPFLYSNPIQINVTKQTKEISFELIKETYYQEPLFTRAGQNKMIPLKILEIGINYLKCQISKESLDIIANLNNYFEVGYLSDYEGWIPFKYISSINIKYEEVIKEDIYFSLDKLQENVTEKYSYVTFSTNVTDLPKIKTDNFNLYFDTYSTNCYFIKHNESEPLYLTCYASKAVTDFIIGEISGFYKNNIHYKYNFNLLPGRNDDKISITYPEGSHFLYVYPETLDFSNTDILDIYL